MASTPRASRAVKTVTVSGARIATNLVTPRKSVGSQAEDSITVEPAQVVVKETKARAEARGRPIPKAKARTKAVRPGGGDLVSRRLTVSAIRAGVMVTSPATVRARRAA